MKILDSAFEICDANWRGLGIIPKSGYRIKDEFSQFDAQKKFNIKKSYPLNKWW